MLSLRLQPGRANRTRSAGSARRHDNRGGRKFVSPETAAARAGTPALLSSEKRRAAGLTRGRSDKRTGARTDGREGENPGPQTPKKQTEKNP